jgi:hypothetical protein
MSKKKISERDLSILCGLADLGKIGMYDFPADEDQAWEDVCPACVYDLLGGNDSAWRREHPGCYLAEEDMDDEMRHHRIEPGWCIGMRLASADDVARLLTKEDDE